MRLVSVTTIWPCACMVVDGVLLVLVVLCASRGALGDIIELVVAGLAARCHRRRCRRLCAYPFCRVPLSLPVSCYIVVLVCFVRIAGINSTVLTCCLSKVFGALYRVRRCFAIFFNVPCDGLFRFSVSMPSLCAGVHLFYLVPPFFLCVDILLADVSSASWVILGPLCSVFIAVALDGKKASVRSVPSVLAVWFVCGIQ